MANLRVTYDRESDIAYFVINGEVSRKVDESRICEEVGDPVQTILDMDEQGHLMGIEVRNASFRLPERLLDEAEPAPPPK
jgi:uncharacterized protein YuzE